MPKITGDCTQPPRLVRSMQTSPMHGCSSCNPMRKDSVRKSKTSSHAKLKTSSAESQPFSMCLQRSFLCEICVRGTFATCVAQKLKGGGVSLFSSLQVLEHSVRGSLLVVVCRQSLSQAFILQNSTRSNIHLELGNFSPPHPPPPWHLHLLSRYRRIGRSYAPLGNVRLRISDVEGSTEQGT